MPAMSDAGKLSLSPQDYLCKHCITNHDTNQYPFTYPLPPFPIYMPARIYILARRPGLFPSGVGAAKRSASGGKKLAAASRYFMVRYTRTRVYTWPLAS